MGVDLTLMISQWRWRPGEIVLISDQLFLDRESSSFWDKIRSEALMAIPSKINIEDEDGRMEIVTEDAAGHPLTFLSVDDCVKFARQTKCFHNALAFLYASSFREDAKVYLYWH